ncbi:MAG: hypothetical protein A2Y12_02520 [Planctomycetes bacterium GWF2_42_9]|nr:MAG: hypothetical protein A2Y12_02520 [Planctomycetes bacterium GWF2_42_9]
MHNRILKIGIIGAENSHTTAIAQIINVDKLIKGFYVDYVWGENDDAAAKAAEAGRIPNIVKDTKDMLGKIDALVVDHRHAQFHLKPAIPFITERIPTFIDKPFCYRVAEGKNFLNTARKYKTPVTSFSIIPDQSSFKQFCKSLSNAGQILSGGSYGPCDINSQYGGIFFYGVHQVELLLKAYGYNVTKVGMIQNCNGSTGHLIYDDGKIITMNFIREGTHTFGIHALGTKQFIYKTLVWDKAQYLSGIRRFTDMFRTGQEPESHDHILKPVAILEALEKAVKSGNLEVIES